MNAISVAVIIQLTFQVSTGQPPHVYEVISTGTANFQEATEYCLNEEWRWYDYTLAVIETDDDLELVREVYSTSGSRRRRITDDTAFWVGLYKQASGVFAWVDGTPCETNDGLCVSNWVTTPDLNANADKEYCVTLTYNTGYEAVSCNGFNRYVCSYINSTTPPPIHEEDAAIGYCGQDTYSINGQTCVVSGDPHFTTFRGGRHDYQGNPHINYESFYYVAPCYDASANDMPFTIIGNHYFLGWSNREVTSLDYLTLELFPSTYGAGNPHDKYYLFLSTHTQAYIYVDDMDVVENKDIPQYDPCKDEPKLKQGANFLPDAYRSIGSRFQVKYTQSRSNRIEVWLKIDNVQQVHFTMYGYYNYGVRNRGHTLYLDVPASYRCFICGLCGDFRRARDGGSHDPQTLITCKGGLVSYEWGWMNNHPGWEFAYDFYGNTWGYEYVNEQCPLWDLETRDAYADRRRLIAAEDLIYTPDVGTDFVFVDPCDSSIEQQVITACQAARDASTDDCNIMGSAFCDDLQASCEIDACVNSGTDATVIDAEVQIAFTDQLQFAIENQNAAAAHAFVPNQDSFIGKYPQRQSPSEKYHDYNGYNDYNGYEPNGYWNNSGVVDQTSTWLLAACLLLSVLLTVNCVYMCYVNTSQQRGKGYAVVKYIESEYDSEAPIIQQKN